MSMERAEREVAEQITGVSNVAYDVMAVLQNKLEGISAMEVYKEDAEEEGDQELRDLFEQIQQRDIQDVEKLKKMLVKHMR